MAEEFKVAAISGDGRDVRYVAPDGQLTSTLSSAAAYGEKGLAKLSVLHRWGEAAAASGRFEDPPGREWKLLLVDAISGRPLQGEAWGSIGVQSASGSPLDASGGEEELGEHDDS
jgi:hypothetical protein